VTGYLYPTERNMDSITLVESGDVWRFEDGKGRHVRLSIIVAPAFDSEADARRAAERLGPFVSVTADGRLTFDPAAYLYRKG
jgi:hypothetical protein